MQDARIKPTDDQISDHPDADSACDRSFETMVIRPVRVGNVCVFLLSA